MGNHSNKPLITAAFTNTKGGTGKSTMAANLGGALADPDIAGLKVLLIDLDQSQPALSSYYPLAHRARGGIFELMALGQTEDIISHTAIPGLDIIVSNDPQGKLPNILLHAPDGRFRLKAALPKLSQGYDVVLADTKGENGILVETALLSVDQAICPVPAETLPARELRRGMLELLRSLERLAALTGGLLKVPALSAFINVYDERTLDAQTVVHQLRNEVFANLDPALIRLLDTEVPRRTAFREAATFRTPVHQLDAKRSKGSNSPCAAELVLSLLAELFPQVALRNREVVA